MSDIQLTAEVDFRKAEGQVDAFVKKASKKLSDIMAKAAAPGGSASGEASSKAKVLKAASSLMDGHVSLWKKHAGTLETLQKQHEARRIAIQVNSGKMTTAYYMKQIADRQRLAAKEINAEYKMREDAVQTAVKQMNRRKAEQEKITKAESSARAKEINAEYKMREDAVASSLKLVRKKLAEEDKANKLAMDSRAKEIAADFKMQEDAIASSLKLVRKQKAEQERLSKDQANSRAKEIAAEFKMRENAVQDSLKLLRKQKAEQDRLLKDQNAERIRLLKQTGGATTQVEDVTRRIGRQINDPKIQKELIDKLNKSMNEHNRILTTFGTKSLEAAQAQVKFRREIKEVTSEIVKQGGLLKTLRQGFTGFNKSIGDLSIAGQKLGRFIVNTQVAFSALMGVFGFREILQITQDIQTFENTLKAVSPTAKDAADNIAFLKTSADVIGFSFRETGKAMAQFAAAGYQAGAATEQIQQVFLRVTSAARNLGLSSENTEGVIKALTQSISKGTFQAEEIRQQLGDRLPFAMQALAKATGVSTEKLMEMMQKGQLSTSKYLIPFAEALLEASGGMAALENSSQGVAAYLGRVDNAWTNLIDTAGKNGMNKALIELLSAFERFLKGNGATEAMNLFSKAISSVASGVSMLSKGFESMTPILKVLGDNLDFVLTLMAGYVAYSASMAVISGIVTTTATAYNTLTTAITAATSAQELFNKSTAIFRIFATVMVVLISLTVAYRKEIASTLDMLNNLFPTINTGMTGLMAGLAAVREEMAKGNVLGNGTDLGEVFMKGWNESLKKSAPDGKEAASTYFQDWLKGSEEVISRLKITDIFKELTGDFGTSTVGSKDKTAERMQKYFDREHAKLIRELETLTDVADAWENYYERKGLGTKEAGQLSALRDINTSFKDAEKIVKGLENISDAFNRTATDDDTARVIKMAKAYRELGEEISNQQKLLSDGNLPEENRSAILTKIAENSKLASSASESYGKALNAITQDAELDLKIREERIKLLKAEAQSAAGIYKNTELEEERSKRALEIQEESNVLGRLNDSIIDAQNKGFEDQVKFLTKIRDLYEEIFANRAKTSKATEIAIAEKPFNQSTADLADTLARGDFSKSGLMNIADSFGPVVDSFLDLKEAGKSTSDIFGDLAENLLKSGKGTDALLGLAGALMGRSDSQNKNAQLGQKIGGQVGSSAFKAMGLPPEFGKILGKIGGNFIGGLFGMSKKEMREMKQAAELNALTDSMNKFFQSAVKLTDVGQQMAELDARFGVLKTEAIRLKQPIDALTASYQKQREAIQKEFMEGIESAILGTIDSALQEYAELKKVQQTRIKASLEAETGLAKVRELNARETAKFFEKLTTDQLLMMGSLASSLDIVKAKIRDMSSIITDQISKMQDQAREVANLARQSAAALRSASEAIRRTISDLQTGPMSPLSPSDQYALTLQQFDVISQKALAGDQDSLQKLPDASNALLEAAKNMFATGPEYVKIFEKVRGILAQAGVVADVRATALEQIASLAEVQVTILEDIREILTTDLGASFADALTVALSDADITAGERDVLLSRLDAIALNFANIQGPAADAVKTAIENLRPYIKEGALTDAQKILLTKGYTDLNQTLNSFKTDQLKEYRDALIAAGDSIKALDTFLLDPEGKIPAAVAEAFKGGWFDQTLTTRVSNLFRDALGTTPISLPLSGQIYDLIGNAIGTIESPVPLTDQIIQKINTAVGAGIPDDKILTVRVSDIMDNAIGEPLPAEMVFSTRLTNLFTESIGTVLTEDRTLTSRTDKTFSDTIGQWSKLFLVDRIDNSFTDTIGMWGEKPLTERINEAFQLAIGGSPSTPFGTTLTNLLGNQSALVSNINTLITSISGLTAAMLDTDAQSAADSSRATQMQSFVNSVRSPLTGIDAAFAAIPDDDPSGSHNNRTNVMVDSTGNVVNIGGNKQSDLSRTRATQLGSNLSTLARQLEVLTGGKLSSFEASSSEKYSGYSIGGINKLTSFAGNDFEGIARNFIFDALANVSGGDQSIIDILKQQDYTNILAGFTSAAQAIFEKNNPRTIIQSGSSSQSNSQSAEVIRDKEYLARYPDVAAAVAQGIYSSGLDHYNQYGKDEFRLYAAGGRVTGGIGGYDSVPALLMPEERVLNVPHSRMLETIYSMASGSNDSEFQQILIEELKEVKEELAAYRKEQADRDNEMIVISKKKSQNLLVSGGRQ